MPVIGAIIGAIATAVASVITGIITVITKIISAIATVVSFVFSKAIAVIAGIVHIVTTTIVPVMGVIVNFIASTLGAIVSRIIQGFTFIITKIWGFVAQVWVNISSIVGTIKGFVTSIIGIVRNILSPIISFIRNIVTSITGFIRHAITKFKEIYSVIKASTIGKIIGYIKKIADFISFVHTIAIVVKAVEEKKYAKAFYLLALSFDEKLAKDIKEIRELIDSSISSVLKDVSEMFTLFRKDVTSVMGYASYLEILIRDIAKGFDVDVLEDLAEGIRRFRKDTLLTVREWIDIARKRTLEWITEQIHPITQLIRMARMTEREWMQYQRIYSYLGANSLVRVYPKILPRLTYSLPRFKK